MNEFFEQLFDEVLLQKNNDIIKLESDIILTNPYSQQEYTLTHRYKSSLNTFTCEDLAHNKWHIKIVPCKSYSEVKKGLGSLDKITEKCQSNAMLGIFDSFEILNEDSWYLIIVTPSLQAATLYQLAKTLESKDFKITKDLSIGILLVLIETIEEIYNHNTNFDCIYPNTIMICKGDGGLGLFTINNTVFTLKISPISRHTLIGDETDIENLYLKDSNYLWGISISLYSIIGKVYIQNLPDMKNLTYEEIVASTPLIFEDPALESIFRAFQKGDKSVFGHRYFTVWKGLCNQKWDLVDKCTIKDLETLHSGLLFSNSVTKKMVIKKLLILASNYHEVYEYLLKYNLFILFVEECLKFDWTECIELLETFFKILKIKPKDSAFKEKLGELGLFGIIYTTIALDPDNKAFCDFLQDYANETTLTLMQVLFDSGVTNRSLELAKRSPLHKDFIKNTMPFYGPNSPKLIEQVYNMDIFPVKKIIQAIIDIPFYHKLEKIESVLEFINNIIKRKGNKEEYLDIIKNTLDLMSDILILPLSIQANHLAGRCSSHIVQDTVSLQKNPYLYYCIDCTSPLCSACCRSMHSSHNTYNLLYFTTHFRCNCFEAHTLPEIHLSDFILTGLNNRFTFIPSSGNNTTESYLNKFSSSSDMIITTIEPLVAEWSHVGQGVVAYYEVKINKAGKYENIVVGLLGAEIYYHGVNGNIIINGKLVCKGPRFGSYDLIGVGLLRNSKVFFTYNGLLSSYIFDCDANQEIKIYVAMYGDGCEIEIKLKRCFFQTIKPGTEGFSSKAKALTEDIFKVLIKALKKGKEDRIISLRNQFRSLLHSIQRDDLIKKLGKL